MKARLTVLTVMASLLVAVTAWAAPELSVERGTYDFGTITQGKKVQHNFIIRNSGDAPLQIKQLNASCGCTAARPSTSLVLPGRSAEIEVIFDSANFSGRVEKTVAMTTNAGKAPTYTFKMEGTIQDQVQVSPRPLDIGPLAAGVARQASVSVENRGGTPIKIVSVKSTSNALQIKPTVRKKELKGGESASIELSITARPEAKVLSGYLHITVSTPQSKEIIVPVYATPAK
ncbi:MAG TPA: DUF1573 domain-containing protein [Geomonas sp.]|nr:DUF1573 domain-containing protein [Geomonas sp.]